jgi:hypothetical protein
MPAILDVAIGTFFVFMLFSIVVTALNELVLTFFDKRADFLRLGLGELLGDPQKKAVKGYLGKTLAYGATDLRWVVTWIAGLPLVVAFFSGAPWWFMVLAAILLVGGTITGYQRYGKGGTGSGTAPAAAPGTAPATGTGAGTDIATANTLANTPGSGTGTATGTPTAAGTGTGTATDTATASGTGAGQANQITVESIFHHPLIFSLSKGESDPSYIAAGAFSKAMLDILVPAVSTDGKEALNLSALTMADLRTAILNVKNVKLQRSLAALLRSAEGDVDKFKVALEDWFNHSMDRVTGWYKRHAQTWLVILGFILAVICNVDALRIIRTLSTNPNLAKAVTAQAESYTKANGPPATQAEIKQARIEKDAKIKAAEAKVAAVKQAMAPENLLKAQQELAAAQAAAKGDATNTEPAKGDPAKADPVKLAQEKLDQVKQAMDPKNLEAAVKELEAAENWDGVMADFNKNLEDLRKTGIPMGWDNDMREEFGWSKLDPNLLNWRWSVVFPALCGWALTALAASLGAPFWFDLLQRVMNLRANGRAPEEKALGTKKDDDKDKDKTKDEKSAEAVGLAAGAAAGVAAAATVIKQNAEPPPPPALVVITAPAAAPVPPADIKLERADDTSIKATWQPTGADVSYKPFWRMQGATSADGTALPFTALDAVKTPAATITPVPATGVLEFYVITSSDAGDSPPSATAQITLG